MKKALLVISFGTSYPDTYRKNILSCEQQLADAYLDRDCYRAFTSEMIIKKLKQRDGLDIHNPYQALQALAEAGYQDVLVQSLHIINGDEYEKVARQVTSFQSRFQRLQLGSPLLTYYEDFEQLIVAMQHQAPALEEHERVVFMGHGATHHAFAAYACLDHMLTTKQLPMFVGAVESYPEIDTIVERLIRDDVTKIHLMPLMLVSGDHAINDMASDDEDSWKTRIEAAGIQTQSWLQGLGENVLVREMFVHHLKQAERRDEVRA